MDYRCIVVDSVCASLERVTTSLPNHEDRPSQRAMVEAVARSIRSNRHLVVQAGTGTGKSLGYLVPALALGTRCVVATATKALQDQLAKRDLPLLAATLGLPVDFALLKGRSNYVCRQRVNEITRDGEQLSIDSSADPGNAGSAAGAMGAEVKRLIEWSARAETGDRAELSWEPSASAWAQVSVGPTDCPGAARCPSGGTCYAEAARQRAAEADVVVVNTHLYAAHLASGAEVLPPHDLVVFDEAHELEDIASATLGFEISAGRLRALARACRPLLEDPTPAREVEDAALVLIDALGPHLGRRLAHPLEEDLSSCLAVVRERLTRLVSAARGSGREAGADQNGASLGGGALGGAAQDSHSARRARVLQSGGHLLADVDTVVALGPTKVAWVQGSTDTGSGTAPGGLRAPPVIKVAPIDVAAALSELLWSKESAPTAILASATIPPGVAERVGIAPGSYDHLDVGSPFDYPSQALLYCPVHLPDPRQAGYEAAMIEELEALVRAAGGRTLALFTSWRAMRAAASALAPILPWPVLTQADLPKPALVARFATEEESCLFATMGFWQGVDVPGAALSLVTIDRLPFARPDDPLLQARRERLGAAAFASIDLPRAATLLAQGAGRLIRSRSDRGVVAVLDPRLAKARYRWDLVRAMPPMTRTRHRSEVEAWLAAARAGSAQAPGAPATPDGVPGAPATAASRVPGAPATAARVP